VPGLRGVDLNLLVALAALLEERNLTHAGERINVSQPAMSAALARLRKHFNDDLLTRVSRGYELTSLAEQILPVVQEALRLAEVTLEIPQDFDPQTSRRQLSISISDYALTVLIAPLLELLGRRAPLLSVEFDPLPRDHDQIESCLQRRDLLIGGVGLGIPGRRQVVFRDQFVCIADRDNPRVVPGRALSLDDVAEMRHAAANFGRGTVTPTDRALLRLDIEPRIAVTVPGLLPLPFAVAGTPLIAFVPQRLAERCADTLGLVIAPVAWDPPDLVEAAHWHPARSAEPTLSWLRSILREVSAGLAAPSSDSVLPA
jgi:DNA-binding transcriptional LysR family regulator